MFFKEQAPLTGPSPSRARSLYLDELRPTHGRRVDRRLSASSHDSRVVGATPSAAASWAIRSLVDPAISRRRKATRRGSSSRPVMPKSSRAVRPSGSTSRFPPCRSPWKMPWRTAPSRNPIIPVRTRASVSTPAPRMPTTSSNRKPRPLHHQHPAGDERRVGPGHDVAPLAELGEGPGDVEHVLGLEAEVELLGDGLGEQLDQGRRVGQRGDGDATHQERGEPGHHPQVVAHQAGDRRALDLDDDPLAGPQSGRVDLRDRGRGQRRAVDPPEDVFERAPEVVLEDLAHHPERLGRHPVAAELELVDQLGGEDALARADDLAELDVGGPEPLGGPAQAPGDARRLRLPPGAAPAGPQRHRRPGGGPCRGGRRVASGGAPSAGDLGHHGRAPPSSPCRHTRASGRDRQGGCR